MTSQDIVDMIVVMVSAWLFGWGVGKFMHVVEVAWYEWFG